MPQTNFVDHEKFFDCVHCGLCLSFCPTYVELGTEMDSPRGRIATMRALHEGKFPLDAEVVRHLDLCLGCRACETACPSGVHYGELIESARPFIEEQYRRPWLDRLKRRTMNKVFPSPFGVQAFASSVGIRTPRSLGQASSATPLLVRYAAGARERFLRHTPRTLSGDWRETLHGRGAFRMRDARVIWGDQRSHSESVTT